MFWCHYFFTVFFWDLGDEKKMLILDQYTFTYSCTFTFLRLFLQQSEISPTPCPRTKVDTPLWVRPTHFILTSMGPLSQVSACPRLTTARPQEDRTHQQPATGSQASPRQVQVSSLVPTLRCPTHRDRTLRDPTLRGLFSKDLHSQPFLETPLVSG